MGHSSGSYSTPVEQQAPTAAVAKSAQEHTAQSTAAQNEARSRMRGISSTYSRYSNNDGLGNKLGGK